LRGKKGKVKSMNRTLRILAITILAAMTLAPFASADHIRRTTIYYQSSSGSTWYEVTATKRGAPVYTYTVPVSNAPLYVYEAAAPPPAMGDVKIRAAGPDNQVWIDGEFAGTTDHVMQVALDAGTHDMQLKDANGNMLFAGSVDVLAGQTTEIAPR
jgi:hypothetical protein